MSMAAGGGLPGFVHTYVFTPTENLKSVDIQVGELHRAVLISDCATSGLSVNTVSHGFLAVANGAFVASVSRLGLINTGGSYDYYASNSGGQAWSYADGVLTMSWTSNYYFAAGVTYIVLWD